MAFRVEVTAEAEKDLDSILSWLISEDAGESGFQWFEALANAMATLGEFPERRPLAPESRLFPFKVHQLLYGNKPHIYRIFFTTVEQTVYVLHVRHGRRQAVKR